MCIVPSYESFFMLSLLLLSRVVLVLERVSRKEQRHAFVRMLISPLGHVVSVSLLQMEV
jgi:hypothetical protein